MLDDHVMSSLELRHLSKRFGESPAALLPTDLSVADGELVVIIGPSGCGKSTLLRLIAGIEQASGGQVLIGGRDVTAVEARARGVAMVFQSYALYPHLTVAENIGFPLRVAGLDRRAVAAKVEAVAASLDLTDLLARKPRALSGGQRQRVSIGRAIVREPGVLLLDEPLSNLDAELRVRMRHEFARLHQRLGTTMVYVTHDQIEAMTLANRIVVMEAGAIEQVGAPIALYEAPASARVARAIGSPPMNLLPVQVVAAGETGVRVRLPSGAEAEVAARAPAGAPATLGIRPEHLNPDPDGVVGGRVELFERLGPLSFAHLGDGSPVAVVAQLPSDRAVILGETIRFVFAPRHAHLFGEDGRAYPRVSP